MIRHIVEFRLTGETEELRRHQSAAIGARLTSLVGVVPGLESLHVEPDLGQIDFHWHLVLVSDHFDEEALRSYQSHPAHVEMATWSEQFITDRAIVDYAIGD